ncbi:proteasome assembly chaperone family protein [Actinomarinicola tropica]|uniref:PAC2 family protein n=1 Tax=Actinomarinicola tropica TaxID=2789776 RepID=A0A5Q2RFS0_9ACTN|nr:PAC2 family protein [Actinomarinicola tropica]QGG95679.1 PAC2 family protein [Actinomarinicola tropica]
MTDLYDYHQHPDVESPVLVLALEGWIDAGGAASRAAAALLDEAETTEVATFDADTLLDHRARRPIMHIEAGMNTGLTWPSIRLLALSDARGNDVLVLTGAEPDHHWRAVAGAVVDLALELGTRSVLGLGAYPAAVPHTRPPLLASTATDPLLVEQVGGIRTTVDVPAGIHAAIEDRCRDVGLPAVGLWAQVPHYASGMPYPAAALVLVEKVNELGNLWFPTGSLAEEAAAVRARLDDLVADSAEHLQLLRQLEAQADERAGHLVDRPATEVDLPSGEELAGEIERFLRDQDG